MKRWATLVSFLLFLALCASAVAWAMQLFRPASPPVAAASVPAPAATVDLRAASALFGARLQTRAPAASYVLKGVVVARKTGDSAAIIAVDGKPARAVAVGAEVAPGVTVKEVHPQFVLLSGGNRELRVELPARPSPATELAAPRDGQQRVGPTPEPRSELAEPEGDARQRANRRADTRGPAARSGTE